VGVFINHAIAGEVSYVDEDTHLLKSSKKTGGQVLIIEFFPRRIVKYSHYCPEFLSCYAEY
jgi:hypothetical protein